MLDPGREVTRGDEANVGEDTLATVVFGHKLLTERVPGQWEHLPVTFPRFETP